MRVVMSKFKENVSSVLLPSDFQSNFSTLELIEYWYNRGYSDASNNLNIDKSIDENENTND